MAPSQRQEGMEEATWQGGFTQPAHGPAAAVGSGMRSLGGTIRQVAPASGPIGGAAATVADSLDRAGRYLQSQGLSGMCEKVTNTIRQNPIPALLIGLGIGFLLARATRR